MTLLRESTICIASVLPAAGLRLVLAAWSFKGIDTGWTFYTPYTLFPDEFQLYSLLSLFTTAAWVIAAVAGAINRFLLNAALQARSASSCRSCGYDATSAGG
ncbi:MAG: hypothetical protein SGJ11_08610 [Phycisphaerae bacterium]|nr:hypothetical protein [Phycisphaerae bacterium]